MKMPAEVAKMQTPGERQFGVIDVIISAGGGMKVTRGTSYLRAPTRMHDEKFPLAILGAKINTQMSSNIEDQENTKN